jgi:hypothetical protein
MSDGAHKSHEDGSPAGCGCVAMLILAGIGWALLRAAMMPTW